MQSAVKQRRWNVLTFAHGVEATELSFLSTYLVALDAVARLSPDEEDAPARRREAAIVSTKLHTLLFQLERDELGIGIATDAEQDDNIAFQKEWLKRFRELYEHTANLWQNQANNFGAVNGVQKQLVVADKQLSNLKLELGESGKELKKRIDDLQREVLELVEMKFQNGGITINHGAGPVSQHAAQYEAFWSKGQGVVNRYRSLVEGVQKGTLSQ